LRDVNLRYARITDVDMGGVELRDCNLDGMVIDGISVRDLFAAYNGSKSSA
jgi:uncharacterized protein YjbI with pentapeptide repeats